MHDYLYNDIFGERPESITRRSRNQERLATLNKAIDGFFQKNELDALMRGADSAKPTDLRELQKAIGIEDNSVIAGRQVGNGLAKADSLPTDRYTAAARRLLSKEIRKERKTAFGTEFSIPKGMQSAWEQFQEHATPAQRRLVGKAISDCDTGVFLGCLRQAMIASEATL